MPIKFLLLGGGGGVLGFLRRGGWKCQFYFYGGGDFPIKEGIAQVSRDMLQNGVSHRCACVKLSTKRGYRTNLGSCKPPFQSIAQHGVSQRQYRNIARYGATKPFTGASLR